MTETAWIFVVVLGVSFGLGAIAARFVHNASDYYVAGARIPWYLLTGTFLASNVSAGLFLGATNMTGQHGYAIWSAYFTTNIGFFLAIAVVGVLIRRLADHYEIYNFGDILATRYSSRAGAVRAVTAVFLPVIYIPLLAAQFIAMSTIAATTLGLPYEETLAAIVLLVIAYTVLGGMIGVVWSDGFQFLVLIVGLLIAVPIGMTVLGGGDPSAGWQQLRALPEDMFQWTSASWPWYLAAAQLVWIFAIPAQPHLVTRFLAAKDERAILISLPVCALFGLIIYASTVPLGLIGHVTFPELTDGEYFYIQIARQYLGPWLGAIALAGVTAAALSTSSTIMIVAGQSLSRDFYQKFFHPSANRKTVLFVARFSVFVVGACGFSIAHLQFLDIFWLAVLSASLLASVYFVPLMGGLFWKSAGGDGAIAAMISGGLAAVVVFAVNEIMDTRLFISEFFAGLCISIIAMWLATRRKRATSAEMAAWACMRN